MRAEMSEKDQLNGCKAQKLGKAQRTLIQCAEELRQEINAERRDPIGAQDRLALKLLSYQIAERKFRELCQTEVEEHLSRLH
jgi:hypothetical protein